MKLALVSDLHSNKEAADAVFAHIRAQGIQTMVCLGDIVGYGPDPEHCVDLVRGHAEVTVLGNHDEALFTTPRTSIPMLVWRSIGPATG